jgi:Mn-dependent DtxR family transcriptional regulator
VLEASKERLASLFGVARPSLSRELGEMERRGLIRVEGREIAILDEQGLRELRSR